MSKFKHIVRKIKVPDGIIHHWMGGIRIPCAKLSSLLGWIQDHDKHERYFDENPLSEYLPGTRMFFSRPCAGIVCSKLTLPA